MTISNLNAIVASDQSPIEVLRFVENSIQIANWLKASIKVLVSSDKMSEVETLLKSSSFAQKSRDFQFGELHLKHGQIDLNEIHEPDLICISYPQTIDDNSRSHSHLLRGPSHEPILFFRRILEQAPCPVLILPRLETMNSTPFHCLLVPMSGEIRYSASLALALRIAETTHAPIDLLHVTQPRANGKLATNLDQLGEGLSHEYLELIEKAIAEASPFSTPQARRNIRCFLHGDGAASTFIHDEAKRTHGALTILEWKGSLARGHAEIVKNLLMAPRTPLLLVHTGATGHSILRIGSMILNSLSHP
jgi:hypothetical protein